MTWDLHFHSTNSDGSKTPEERLKQIQSLDPNNTWFWALTDHDRFSEDFVGIAQDAWVRVVRGVEISAHSRDLNHSFHVLCYVPQISKKIAALIDRVIIGRTSRVEAQLVKLRANGFEIVDEDFFYWIESQKMSRESATNFHIAHYIRGHRENRELIKHLTNGVISSEHSDRETLKFMSECLRRNGDFNHIGYVEISAYEPEVTELVRIAEAEDLTLAVAHPNFSFNKKTFKAILSSYGMTNTADVWKSLGSETCWNLTCELWSQCSCKSGLDRCHTKNTGKIWRDYYFLKW